MSPPEDRHDHADARGATPRVRKAEKARLSRYLQSIRKHRAALEVAIAEGFEQGFDQASWRAAFDSSDPHDTNRTMMVTGDFSAIVNAYVEMLRASAGSRLLNLLPNRRPHAADAFRAVEADGGLSAAQVTTLNEVYKLEGRLEHASPDVDADEVFAAVELLRDNLPGLIGSTDAWLKRHGVDLS